MERDKDIEDALKLCNQILFLYIKTFETQKSQILHADSTL